MHPALRSAHCALCALCLFACTRAGFQSSAGGRNAHADAGDTRPVHADLDTRPPVDEALAALAFAPALPLAELNSPYDDEGPFLSRNGLRLYFSSARDDETTNVLYVAERSDIYSPFAPPTLVEVPSGIHHHHDPCLSDDELVLVFEQLVVSDAARTIWITSRPSIDAPFAAPTQVLLPDAAANAQSPCISGDGLVLFFAAITKRRKGDLFRASRSSRSGVFGDIVAVEALSSDEPEDNPSLEGDRIVFSSRRAGCGNGATSSLFISRRNATGEFSAPACIPTGLDGVWLDDPALNLTSRTLVFGAEGDIYFSTF